jgi:hypothetical protein
MGDDFPAFLAWREQRFRDEMTRVTALNPKRGLLTAPNDRFLISATAHRHDYFGVRAI